MTIDEQPLCSACHEDFCRGYNTICINIGGQKVNIDLDGNENCAAEDQLQKILERNLENKESCCGGRPSRRQPSAPEDEDSFYSGATREGGAGDRNEEREWTACCSGRNEMDPKILVKEPEATPPLKGAKRRGKVDSVEAKRWKYIGPPWYTALSDIQVQVVDSLATILKYDIEEGRRKRTVKALSELGVSPMPTLGQIHVAMSACITNVKSPMKREVETERLGAWSAFEGASNHEMRVPSDRQERDFGEDVSECEETEGESVFCHDSTTPPTDGSTEDEYREENMDGYLLPETRWCEWCGECNTHCAAFMPALVCDAEGEEKGIADCEETGEEAKARCDWCGNCDDHCPFMMLPSGCEAEEPREEGGDDHPGSGLEDAWEEAEGEGTQESLEVDGEEEDAEAEREEADGEETKVEEGMTKALKDEDEETLREGSQKTIASRNEKKVLVKNAVNVTSASSKHLALSMKRPRASTRAPLETIMSRLATSKNNLEIVVDPVEFLLTLYNATGQSGGKVWESSFPQRDRLLLSSAARLQLPRTIEWLDKILPRRLRTDNLIFTEAGRTNVPKRKCQAENEAATLKTRCKKETRRHGKSPYLTYFQLTENDKGSPEVNGHPGRIRRKEVIDGRGQSRRKVDNMIIVRQVMEALKRVSEEFGDPIARLPFAWKLPEVRLWLDKRRRKSVPEFASIRPKMTPKDKRKMFKFCKTEWANLRADPYEVEIPKIPKQLTKIPEFNMSHFKAGRKEGEKMRNLYTQRFKRAVLEETRDYWPTMCPYASLPVPWKSRPQTPPLAELPNFRRVISRYLPTREKDILIA